MALILPAGFSILTMRIGTPWYSISLSHTERRLMLVYCTSSIHIGLPHCILKPKESIELAVLLNGRGEKVKARGNIFNGEIRNFFEIANEHNRVETIISLVVAFLIASGGAGLIIYFNPNLRPIDAYLITTTTFTLLFWLYVFYRISHPFKCTCGYRTHFLPFFKRHVLQKHRRASHSF